MTKDKKERVLNALALLRESISNTLIEGEHPDTFYEEAFGILKTEFKQITEIIDKD